MSDKHAAKTLCEFLLQEFPEKLRLAETGASDWLRSPHRFVRWGEEFQLLLTGPIGERDLKAAAARFYTSKKFKVRREGHAFWLEKDPDVLIMVNVTCSPALARAIVSVGP
jgi:hypothetical protein